MTNHNFTKKCTLCGGVYVELPADIYRQRPNRCRGCGQLLGEVSLFLSPGIRHF